MNTKTPVWLDILQVILTLIMLQQVFMFYLDHQSVAASGIVVDGVPNLNLLCEFAGRTATMAVASIFLLITQNPQYFLVVLLMNILREGQEKIIDPLFPLSNAPGSPIVDFVIHIVIMVIEILAFIAVLRIVKRLDRQDSDLSGAPSSSI